MVTLLLREHVLRHVRATRVGGLALVSKPRHLSRLRGCAQETKQLIQPFVTAARGGSSLHRNDTQPVRLAVSSSFTTSALL